MMTEVQQKELVNLFHNCLQLTSKPNESKVKDLFVEFMHNNGLKLSPMLKEHVKQKEFRKLLTDAGLFKKIHRYFEGNANDFEKVEILGVDRHSTRVRFILNLDTKYYQIEGMQEGHSFTIEFAKEVRKEVEVSYVDL